MQSSLESIISELGESLELNLKLPDNGVCSIQFEQKYEVQIHVDNTGLYLVLIGKIAPLPPGGFANKVLEHAMRFNATEPFRYATVGYSLKSYDLVLHTHIPLEGLTGSSLAPLLSHFTNRLKEWIEAIEDGNSGPNIITTERSSKPPPFGLKL